MEFEPRAEKLEAQICSFKGFQQFDERKSDEEIEESSSVDS